jgi:hypothetical protein
VARVSWVKFGEAMMSPGKRILRRVELAIANDLIAGLERQLMANMMPQRRVEGDITGFGSPM